MGPPAYVEIGDTDRATLAAPPQMGERPYKMGISSGATRIRRKCNPPSMAMAVAGPSHVHSAENLNEGITKEIALLERFISGHRMSDYQWEGLFSMCQNCGQHLVRSKLSGHAKVCSIGLIILGLSSEVDPAMFVATMFFSKFMKHT